MSACRSALVTGATGFIGQHLVRRLIDEGVTTHCVVRAASLTPQVQQRLAGAHLLALRGDAPEDWSSALRGVNAECVFHLASAGVIHGVDSPQATIEANVRLMCRLLTAISDWDLKHVVYAGSFSEYGDSPDSLSEQSPLLPNTCYGASKAAAWLCGRSLALQLGLPLVNLRLFHVYGPGEAPRRLIPNLYSHLSRRQPIALTAGMQVRDVVYVSDIVEALLAATLLPPAKEPLAYNVCTGNPVSIRHIGEMVAQQLGAPQSLLRWGEVPYRPGEPLHVVGDNRRFAGATGWQPRVSLDEGVARTLKHCAWESSFRKAG